MTIEPWRAAIVLLLVFSIVALLGWAVQHMDDDQ